MNHNPANRVHSGERRVHMLNGEELSEGRGMFLRIIEIDLTGPHSLRLGFNNGVTKCVNLLPLLTGPLQEPSYFAQVVLDAQRGAVVWPNGTDFAAKTLYDLPEEGISAEEL
jgi:Protein of unknown function (DUF2442)